MAYGFFTATHKLMLGTILAILTTQAAQAEDTFTIIAFGDSLTRGYGLPEDQGFVPQLQAWLTANGGKNITVVNAGLSGDTTAGGLARIDWTLTDDVDAVIVALGGNDMLRGIWPSSSHENLDGIVALLTERDLPVLLVGLPAPTNFGPEFKAEFDAMYPAVATKYEALLYRYFFDGFGTAQDTAAISQYMQDDATHPNAEGVLLIVAHMGPMVLELAR
ncbi:hypothetical protein A9Q96_07290 [Rhodobacterales bacterium 52_120_T64]|nr:hypothetical protein A9Q96_07290 [Rhodobacterales bacterium 52_120_T64]